MYFRAINRLLIVALSCCWAVFASGQEYPVTKKYVSGSVMLRDSTVKTGQIRWFPTQNGNIKFRIDTEGEAQQYTPVDLLSFTVDTLMFVPLFDLEAYTNDYAMLGKSSKIKQTFGHVIHRGDYNIYMVLVGDYDALNERVQTFANFIFEQKSDSGAQYAAYPLDIRMKYSRYEKAKDGLYTFFKNHPDVVEKIKAYNPQDDFSEVVTFMRN